MNQNLAYYSAVLGEDKAGTISARQVQSLYLKLYLEEAFVQSTLWVQLFLAVYYVNAERSAENQPACGGNKTAFSTQMYWKETYTSTDGKLKHVNDCSLFKEEISTIFTAPGSKCPYTTFIVH